MIRPTGSISIKVIPAMITGFLYNSKFFSRPIDLAVICSWVIPDAAHCSFMCLMYAREHGIQGTVVITVTVNEFGQLEDAVVTHRIGGGCDEEALRIVLLQGQQGFEPAEKNGLPVKVRYGIPLRFILQ